MTPPVGPQLEVAHVEIAEEIVRWTITARNIDAISYESLLPCQFQLDLLDRPNALPKAEPVKLADFMVNGAKAGPVVASAGAPGEIEVRHPVDLAGGHVRLAVSDPAGRFDCLVLKPLSN